MKSRDKITYLDNGATTFPKPPEVIKAYADFCKNIGASPGRGSYEPAEITEQKINHTREYISKLIGADDPQRIVFTKNATEALNMAIFGILQKGDKVVTTRMEHNSVIRPLLELERSGIIEVFWANVTDNGRLDIEHLLELMEIPDVKLVVTTGIANSTGVILPFWQIGEYCRENDIIYLVDGAQLCGVYPVNVLEDNIDMLAFTGHKGMYGVPGTGGLYVGKKVEKMLKPLLWGGTGGQGDLPSMPDVLPTKFEAGTPNSPGIIALGEGVQWVIRKSVEAIHQHKQNILSIMLELLRDEKNIKLFGPKDDMDRTAIVPVVIPGSNPKDIAKSMWNRYNIAVRAGCHCAPHIHFDLGEPQGTVRFSFGTMNTVEDAEYAAEAIIDIANELKK
ncbi:cysteine desulfurase [bacterium]|nr:MAG: cysteine desulfurase [bacterium]